MIRRGISQPESRVISYASYASLNPVIIFVLSFQTSLFVFAASTGVSGMFSEPSGGVHPIFLLSVNWRVAVIFPF